jgi:hypothetical protein
VIKKALSGALLSLVLGFVTQWLNLLRHVPYLVHPDWENQAGHTAVPFSIALVVILIIVFSGHGTTKRGLGIWSLIFAGIWIVLMFICVYFYFSLDAIADAQSIEQHIRNWLIVYESALLASVATGTAVGFWLVA